MKPEVRAAVERLSIPRWADPADQVQTDAQAMQIIIQALDEGARLDALVNNPQTVDFLHAVNAEAAHQVEKWGEAHDRGKSAENWFWLVGYLGGKCLRAVITGNRQKALHHTISTAAACANWHKAISRDETGCGAGADLDIAPIEISRFAGVNIDAAHHSRQDREHVHYLGGSGHGTTVHAP